MMGWRQDTNSKKSAYLRKEMANKTKQYEGFEDLPYYDTKGSLTSGFGFNLEDPHVRSLLPNNYIRAISGDTTQSPVMDKKMADPVFNSLMDNAKKDAKNYLGEKYDTIDEDARNVLDDLSYNIGATKLKKFDGFKKALISGDYDRAAEELKWVDPDKKNKLTPYWTETKTRARDHYNSLKDINKKQLEAELLRQIGGE